MKILFVSNNKHYDYDKFQIGLIAMINFWRRRGIDVRTVAKNEQFNFYSIYKEFRPDVILATWVPGGTIPVFLKKLGLIEVPIIHLWNDYYKEMMEKYPSFLVGLLENFSVKNSDYIITVSKFNEIRAKKLGKRVWYIPHGIRSGKKKSKINLTRLKTDKENLIVIYLGEQSLYKKVDEVINAVRDKKCDLFLFGETNKEFEKISGKNVHFMGSIPSEEVNSILKQADILVNTSDQDCNFKLFEYINSGKPILGYEGRLSLLLKHKENAYLTKDFSKGLLELIDDKKLREKISKNIMKFKTYTWEEIADKHLEIIGRVLRFNTLK